MGNYIKEVVNAKVRKYGTRNPFELAKKMNIEVQIGNPGCAGCYMYLKKHRYIFLNQYLEEREMLHVMAHELGHAILHRTQNCYFIRNYTLLLNSKAEREANMFAAELLIDDSLLSDYKHYTVSQIARLTGYAEALVQMRMF